MENQCIQEKKIDLDELLNSNKYDIDHIIPQSKIKDDSFNNIVLVEKEIYS
ncbi:HNH endonuclease domain-containing protein [uncultured Sneathia sp.]|uniref:HNH endonuclease domain-containing protein n=1 Tax=uncultured Sneathia sp. TaxID=278067 RepID=UPI0033903BCA